MPRSREKLLLNDVDECFLSDLRLVGYFFKVDSSIGMVKVSINSIYLSVARNLTRLGRRASSAL